MLVVAPLVIVASVTNRTVVAALVTDYLVIYTTCGSMTYDAVLKSTSQLLLRLNTELTTLGVG